MRSLAFPLLILVATPALAAPEMVTGPVKMRASEIRAYNAQLSPKDPAYIVCLDAAPTGSLIAKRTCRTRGEWERLATLGNDDATAWVSYARTHQFGVNEEPADSISPVTGGID
ncbi:MAG: hypothetical protein ACKOPO_10610 [Novosphingobium sp.]